MLEQGLFVLHELVQAAVELVALRQRGVLAQKIAQSARVPPLPVQAPLAAGIDQPVASQRFQDVQPRGSLAAWRQTPLPEGVELQLLPEIERQPAGAPLPRAVKLEILQAHLHRFAQRLQAPRGRPRTGRSALIRPAPSSKASSAWLHCACWPPPSSPRYSTCRWMVLPPLTRRFSTTLQ